MIKADTNDAAKELIKTFTSKETAVYQFILKTIRVNLGTVKRVDLVMPICEQAINLAIDTAEHLGLIIDVVDGWKFAIVKISVKENK